MVAVGFRMVKKRVTDEPAICVFVSRKVPQKLLARQFLLPTRIGRIRLDVIQIRREEGEVPTTPPQQLGTVLRPGIAVRNQKFLPKIYGTLGLIGSATPDTFGSANNGKPVLLSAAHIVFASSSATQVLVNQQDQTVIAQLARGDGALDAACALLDPGCSIDVSVLGIGGINPSPLAAADIRPGLRVKKSGAATGVTEGAVQAYDAVSKFYTVVPLTGMAPNYEVSMGGDSGAVWLDTASNRPALLHLQGEKKPTDPEIALGRPAALVLSRLKIRLP